MKNFSSRKHKTGAPQRAPKTFPKKTMPMPPETAAGNSTRLQCVLERLGVDSRRHCAAIIAGGNVTVNGVLIREPGFHVEDPENAVIFVQGKKVSPRSAPKKRTLLFNKPRGLICSMDASDGPTIYSRLKGIPERVVSAGRLDRDSDGLLILSNDGALIERLTHPRYGHTKQYRVRVSGLFDEDTLAFLQSPMELDGYRIRPVRVMYEKTLPEGPLGPRHALIFTLREGRKRQIRMMCEKAGLRVDSLTRISINALHLPSDLKVGAYRDITPKEQKLLNTLDTAPLRPWKP